MTPQNALSTLRERFPSRCITISAEIVSYSTGRTESDVTICLGSPNGVTSRNYTGETLESIVRDILGSNQEQRTSEAAAVITAAEGLK